MEENELPFKSAEFVKSWKEWLDFRKEKKLSKYVPTGLKKTFTMLVNISNNDEETAIAIIDQSIANNYQGLFPLKTQNNATNQTRRSSNQPGVSTARTDAIRNWGTKSVR